MFGACASFAGLRVYTCESDSTLNAVQCMTSSMDHSSKLKAHTLLRLDETGDFDDYPAPAPSAAKVRKAENVECGHCHRFFHPQGIYNHQLSCNPVKKARVQKPPVECEFCHEMFHVKGIGRHRGSCPSKA